MQRNVKGEERKEKNKEHDVVKGRTAKNIFIYSFALTFVGLVCIPS